MGYLSFPSNITKIKSSGALGRGFFEGDGETASRDGFLLEHGRVLTLHRADCVGLRVCLIVGAKSIGIDGRDVGFSRLQKVKPYHELVRLLSGDIAEEPFAGILGLARDCDVLARLGLQIMTLGPVKGDILDELESVRKTLIILRKISRHLER